jgi:hypothetical protein
MFYNTSLTYYFSYFVISFLKSLKNNFLNLFLGRCFIRYERKLCLKLDRIIEKKYTNRLKLSKNVV